MFFTIKDSSGITLARLGKLMELMESDIDMFKSNVITIYADAKPDNNAEIIGSITFEKSLLWSLSYRHKSYFADLHFEGKEMLKSQIIDVLMKLEVWNND